MGFLGGQRYEFIRHAVSPAWASAPAGILSAVFCGASPRTLCGLRAGSDSLCRQPRRGRKLPRDGCVRSLRGFRLCRLLPRGVPFSLCRLRVRPATSPPHAPASFCSRAERPLRPKSEKTKVRYFDFTTKCVYLFSVSPCGVTMPLDGCVGGSWPPLFWVPKAKV